MPFTVRYDPDSSFVVTVFKGKVNLKELLAEEDESIALAIKNGTYKFLVDLVDCESCISIMDLYEFPNRYEEKLKRPICVAVMKPLSPKAQKDLDFYETVCRNRGWNIMTFEKKEDSVIMYKKIIYLFYRP
jgi:hypothetical protein